MMHDRQALEREVTAFLESVNKYEIDIRGLDLTYYGEALAFAIPRFILVLRDTGDAYMQSKRHLISCTASILGSIGRKARCAIPDLKNLLKFRDSIIRVSAFDAIVQITEAFKEEPEIVDAIIEELESALREMDVEIVQREQLQDVMSTIQEKRRGGWQNLQEIGEAVQHWASKKSTHIKAIYLFGSRVRKDFTPESDLDIAIELRLPAGDDERAFWLQNVDTWCQELEQQVPCQVDLHWLKDAEQTPEIHRGVQQAHLQVYQDGDLVWNQFTSVQANRDSQIRI